MALHESFPDACQMALGMASYVDNGDNQMW